MRLHRHIFFQILVATIFTVALFVFVLVVGNALREVVGLLASGRLTWGLFLFLIAVLIPGVVPYALPLGLLTAVLLVLGRMSAQNEILAMKAAGFSLFRITAPVFAVALLGTVMAAAISFYYAPVADITYRETLANVVRNDPLRFLQPRTFIRDFPGFVIYVGERKGGELHDFFIWELGQGGKVTRFIKAESGYFSYDEAADAIIIHLVDATAEMRRDSDPENLQDPGLPVLVFQETAIRLPLAQILGPGQQSYKLSLLPLGELWELRTQALADGDSEDAFRRRIDVQTAIQRKFAFSFSVLSLCLIAIPLGIKASRSETYANIAIALALSMSFYLLTIVISWTEKNPALRPDLLIWIPNFLFQAAGITLFLRANR